MSAALKPVEAARGMLRVTEAYTCVEGEGRTAGARTFLIRLSGCNLRCWWCDSKYSSFDESEARAVSWATLKEQAVQSGAPWVSLTGGEPTWRGAAEMESLAALCAQLHACNLKVKLESNGLAFPAGLIPHVDLWSVSPKWDARKATAARPGGDYVPGVWSRTAAMDYDEHILKAMMESLAAGRLQIKLVLCADATGRVPEGEWMEAAHLLSQVESPRLAGVPIFLIPQAYEVDGAWDGQAYLRRLEALEQQASRLKGAPFDGLDLRVQAQRHRLLHGDRRGV